jgi:hypothetical protein
VTLHTLTIHMSSFTIVQLARHPKTDRKVIYDERVYHRVYS